jgi:hypothetical protein
MKNGNFEDMARQAYVVDWVAGWSAVLLIWFELTSEAYSRLHGMPVVRSCTYPWTGGPWHRFRSLWYTQIDKLLQIERMWPWVTPSVLGLMLINLSRARWSIPKFLFFANRYIVEPMLLFVFLVDPSVATSFTTLLQVQQYRWSHPSLLDLQWLIDLPASSRNFLSIPVSIS